MTRVGTPVAQLRRLRGVLRRERESTGLTQKDVADALDWSLSKLIRIEKGPVGISVTDLKALLLQYRITDADRVNELVEMARGAKQPAWWDKYRDMSSPQFLRFLGLEASAIRLRQLQITVVPGILQVPDYARTMIAPTEPIPERVDRGVEIRMQRQRLIGPDGPEMVFILDESVLYRSIGGPAVMRAQLLRLIELADQPNVTIQVLPFSAGMHQGMRSSFEIFEMSEAENDFALLIEQPYQDTLIDETSDEVVEYVNIFLELEKIALSPDDSVQLIEQVLARTEES
jgi:transcriptional regulator with XRE-family HTH domain